MYPSFEEAQREADKRKGEWFCPIINAPCRHDCYCYKAAQAYPVKNDQWGVNFPSCLHFLLNEEREVGVIINEINCDLAMLPANY